MIENIINNNENLKGYQVYVICMWKEKLCIVPCDSEMSGDYPIYDKAVALSEKGIYNFPNKIDGQTIDGIIIRVENDGFEIDFAENSWDGFQSVGDL